MDTILVQVLSVIETLAKFEPVLVATAQNLKPFAISLYNQFSGHEATADEQAAIEAAVDVLHAKLQEPLPAAQPGDPDYVPPAG